MSQNGTGGVPSAGQGVSHQRDTQQTVSQQTVKQQQSDSSAVGNGSVAAALVENDSHGRALRIVPIHGGRVGQRQSVLRTSDLVVHGFRSLSLDALHSTRTDEGGTPVHVVAVGRPRRVVERQIARVARYRARVEQPVGAGGQPGGPDWQNGDVGAGRAIQR